MLNLSGGAFQFLISLAATETQGSIEYGSATIRRGGDRQIMIRSDGNFGAEGTTEFWFDNITYKTWTDCDNDGRPDEDFLLTPFGMDFDRDGDGIQDNCQDCNDNCPGDFPIGVGDIACLDPQEIVASGDCNDNGIPDDCDVNASLPFEGMFEVGGCTPDSVLDICFHSRRGGGSCDLDANGIPDECEGDDCDGNGCLDTAQITLDPSLDLNGNGILDVCEADCNNNGQPDTFDISTGASQDHYPDFPIGDGVPDECCSFTPNGDMNGDTDVDSLDYQLIQQCVGIVAGSASGLPDWDGNACGCADLNDDGVVNEIDIQVFLYFVTGPQ
jgi:hypothetical protein